VPFTDQPIPVSTAGRGKNRELINTGFPAPSTGPRPDASPSSNFPPLVFTLDSFEFVDAVLRDPLRTSTSLTSAAIHLQVTMSSDDNAASTLALVVAERKKIMTRLQATLLKEAHRLDKENGGVPNWMVEDGTDEEQTPVASTSRSHAK